MAIAPFRTVANSSVIMLPSEVRISNTLSADFNNSFAKGAKFFVNVSDAPATTVITVRIHGKDLFGSYYTILESVKLINTGNYLFEIYPGISEVANYSVSRILPETYRVRVSHLGADPITYAVSASLIV